MATIDRDAMEQRIQNYLDQSTDTTTRGNLYILYERFGQFKWFPGKGYSKRRSESKHWKLVINIGDDRVIIDFVENGDNTKRGIVILSDYDRYRGNSQLYFLGNITIDTEKLYSDIHDMFTEWTRYSIKHHNCQHFAQNFLAHFWHCLSNTDDHIYEVAEERRVAVLSRLASVFNTVGSRSNSTH